MAEEPKPDTTNPAPASESTSPSTSISPAPTDVTDQAPGKDKPEGADPAASNPPANASEQRIVPEPLSDGTTPTVLAPGQSHRSIPKGKATLTSVYRKADIITTLLTFVGAIVAGAIILGAYTYLTRSKTKAPPTPKVTSLDKSELDKLEAFFNGNSAGNSAEVLTISSSSLFKNRVAVSSDLKVVGGLQVSGTTALGDLTVDKTSTLGITNVRGQLTVAGPTSLQGPVTLGNGASITGNLTTTGSGSFGGSLSAGVLNVKDISVSGTLNLNGHLSIGGQNPSATPASSLATSAAVTGNDSGGTVTVTVPPIGNQPSGGTLVTVHFHTPYAGTPHIVITPLGRASAVLEPYVLKTANDFTIGATAMSANSNTTSYSFDYWVVQ